MQKMVTDALRLVWLLLKWQLKASLWVARKASPFAESAWRAAARTPWLSGVLLAGVAVVGILSLLSTPVGRVLAASVVGMALIGCFRERDLLATATAPHRAQAAATLRRRFRRGD